MIKLETHCHTGGSSCAHTPYDLIAKRYYEEGYKGVLITNHISESSYLSWEGTSHKEKTDCYFKIYRESAKAFSKLGIKAYLGAEIAVKSEIHAEFGITGFSEDFVYDHNPLFTYTQEELFELCDKRGVFMWKVHPFRTGEYSGNPKFMHGAEYFNGHFHHANNNALAEKFCEENGLIKLSGTDFHLADQPITAGITVENLPSNEFQLIKLFKSGDYGLICKNKEYEESYLKYLSTKEKNKCK